MNISTFPGVMGCPTLFHRPKCVYYSVSFPSHSPLIVKPVFGIKGTLQMFIISQMVIVLSPTLLTEEDVPKPEGHKVRKM